MARPLLSDPGTGLALCRTLAGSDRTILSWRGGRLPGKNAAITRQIKPQDSRSIRGQLAQTRKQLGLGQKQIAAARRPGGRSERVRQAVLDAADDLAERGKEITVAAPADRASVLEVTIYRRWRAAENVPLDAAVQDASRRLPLLPRGSCSRI